MKENSVSRIAVIGSSGSGKSTIAIALAAQTRLPHVELDCLKYRPGWTMVSDDQFLADVTRTVEGNQWIIEGNYEAAQEVVWARSELVLWLDYSLTVCVTRFCFRTFRRLLTGEEFANGNQEEIRRLIGRNSMLSWTIRNHGRQRRDWEEQLSEARFSQLQVVRLRSPAEGRKWLRDCSPASIRGNC